MKSFTFNAMLSICVASAHALAPVYDSCTSTTSFPPITISTPTSGNSLPVQVYTVTYSDFGPTGLTQKAYTVSETCQQTCQPHENNAVPADFTSAVVVCNTCDSGQPMTEILTYPTSSESAISQSGYIISPLGASPMPVQTQPASGGSGGSMKSSSHSGSVSASGSIAVVPGATNTPETVPVAGSSSLRTDYLFGTAAGLLGFVMALL